MHYFARLFLFTALVFWCFVPVKANQLDNYLRKNRVLVVYKAEAYPDFLATEEAYKAGIEARDLVILKLTYHDRPEMHRFALKPRDLPVILLIGKDGTLKKTYSESNVSFEDIFRVIDAMPMRQREMNQQ